MEVTQCDQYFQRTGENDEVLMENSQFFFVETAMCFSGKTLYAVRFSQSRNNILCPSEQALGQFGSSR
jgi:hypothetical protein